MTPIVGGMTPIVGGMTPSRGRGRGRGRAFCWEGSLLRIYLFLTSSVERCHTVLPPFLYRHALLAVVVVLLRLLRLGATHPLWVFFGSWPSGPSCTIVISYISIPNTHLHLDTCVFSGFYTYCCCGTFVPSEPTSIRFCAPVAPIDLCQFAKHSLLPFEISARV